MPRYIDADNITFDISGLVYIDPYDYKQIAFYFLKQLDEMPSAQPERKRGEWVWSDEDASWKCGSCDCVFEEFEWKPEYNFCPNCGADMRDDFSEHMNKPEE